MSTLPAPRSAAWSAFVSGSLRSLCLLADLRSGEPLLVCDFTCPRRAGRFARRWAMRLGQPVAVRREPGFDAPIWDVRIPIALRHTRYPPGSGRRFSWSGGLRGFIAATQAHAIL